MTIEVRCCCDGHLLGYMEGRYQLGRTYRFVLMRRGPWVRFGEAPRITIETLDFQCLPFHHAGTESTAWSMALQSRDYPLESLVAIAQFRPLKT